MHSQMFSPLDESVIMQFFSHVRPTLALALPIMAGQVSQMLIGLVDSAMVGHYSTSAFAGAALALNVANIPTVFGMSVLSGLSVRVAQAQGARDDKRTADLLRHGLWGSVVLGVLITLFMFLLLPLLGHLGQAPKVVQEARPFFMLLALSVLPVIVGMAAKSFGDAMQNPWPPTLLFLASVPLTAFLNWILIYGHLGFPSLGLVGAGIATLLARTISCVALLYWLFFAKRFASVRPARWRGRLQVAQIRELASLGIPTGLQVGVEVGAFSAGAIIVGMLGEIPLAAHQIAITCAGMAFMFPLGIAIATTVRIGNAVGARQLAQIRPIGITSAVIGTLIMMVSGLIFWFFGRDIASAFVSHPTPNVTDAKTLAVVNLAARLLVVASLFQLFDGVQVTMAGALRGLGDATVPMIVTTVGYWFLALPFGYALVFKVGLGAQGMWMGFALGLGIVAVSLWMRFQHRTRPNDLREIAAKLPSDAVLAAH